MVYILLGAGFEPLEALAPCDILRRGGVEVKLVGVGGKTVTGGHGITVQADCTLNDISAESAEMIVLPGGLGGVKTILGSEAALRLIGEIWHSGKPVAAICAAPTILAALHITDGKQATCYPGMENQMGNAVMVSQDCVRDGRILTGRAAGASLDFGLMLLAALRGEEAAQKVQKGIVYRV